MQANRGQTKSADQSIKKRARFADYFGFERNVVIVSEVVSLLFAGEELWKKVLPKYLESLGASGGIIGHFGTAKDFLDAVYPYPGGFVADRVGYKPFFIATFTCFAPFRGAVVLAANFAELIFAFIIGGLRKIGEPPRKPLIVNFAARQLRARTIGLYYLVRSLTITTAATIGGRLCKFSPETPFVAAGVIGIVGTLVFIFTVDARFAS